MSDQYRPYSGQRRRQASAMLNLFVQLGAAFTAIWRLIFRPKRQPLDRVRLLAKMQNIEASVTGDGAPAAQAVLQADSFVDSVMRAVGGRGNSFADRLRSLEGQFDRGLYQALWDVHKLRNTIAHEHPNITASQAHQALAVFRRAASRLGAF
ncbi:MAG: hypothetical protein ACOYBJ_01075 [Patescibacteria group bacterium]